MSGSKELTFEPRHSNSYKILVRPAKTPISLRSLISLRSSLGEDPACFQANSRF